MTTPKDPLWRDILASLASDDLDPDLFERCAADLLRDLFPGLVPVPGGGDAGMDGAIADGTGEPFPLIATTAKDLERNLAKNLESYLERGGSRRNAVFATSRAITPAKRRRLVALAKTKDFTLVQVVERHGIADRLYRDARWRKELLGLSGDPPALAAVPVSPRPFVNLRLIGRDEEKAWLETTTGDRVLVGEPGSGKTFLLSTLVAEGWGLFLASEDDIAITNAIRSQRPRVIVVDDAHRDPSLLERLRRLRTGTEPDFDLVATTWPGGEEPVTRALEMVDRANVRRLELLPRDQIVEILREVGISGPDDLLRILVDQAANKPGLAVTLARLVLVGGEAQFRDVILGRALSRDLIGAFRELIGDRAETILGAFSLGGDRGMALAAVAEVFSLPLPDVQRAVVDLAAGGVLSEAEPGCLAVWPRALRGNLVASVFFRGDGTNLPHRLLLDKAADFNAAVGAILDSAARGAAVGEDLLRNLVLEAQERADQALGGHRARSLWRELAKLGPDHARWVLEHFPGDLMDVAEAALWAAPREAIPRLLEEAERSREAGTSLDPPFQTLREWVRDIDAAPDEWLSRRRELARFAVRHVRHSGDLRVGLEALAVALSPGLAGSSQDPGMGRTIQIRHSVLPGAQLRELGELWREVWDLVGRVDADVWAPVSRLLENWTDLESLARGPLPPADREFARELAREMVRDLARAAASPGVVAALRRFAEELEMTLEVEADPAFALLFPGRRDEGEVEAGETRRVELTDLAARWASEPPTEIGARLAGYQVEAEKVGHSWPLRSLKLSELLATRVDRPADWVEAFLASGVTGNCIAPFVRRVYAERDEGWEALVQRYIADDRTLWTAADLVLTDPTPPRPLLDAALARAASVTDLIDTRSLCGEVPLETLAQLLGHPERDVALAAAVGELCHLSDGEVRDEVADAWRTAMLRADTEEERQEHQHRARDFWVRGIFASTPALAFEWLMELGKRGKPAMVFPHSVFRSAIVALESDQRAALIDHLDDSWPLHDLVPLLIDRCIELYGKLLARPALQEATLYALEGLPDTRWADLAALAIDFGEAPEEIARAAFWGHYTQVGSGRDHWVKWRDAFDRLTADPRPGVQEAAQRGLEEAQRRVREAEKLERKMALKGI